MKKNRNIYVIVALVLVLAVGLGAYFMYGSDGTPSDAGSGEPGDMTAIQVKILDAASSDADEVKYESAVTQLIIFANIEGDNISEIKSVDLLPIAGCEFNGDVVCWLREDNQVEYSINGDLVAGSTETEEKGADYISKKFQSDESGEHIAYLHEHEFIKWGK